ncbi:DUF971 domain-containing protein [Thalassotalea sp. Y01]|nr:DUF971 domain-containing protein [Thalassotalea sp. Y01]
MITKMQLNHQDHELVLHFDDNFQQSLSYEFLRVYSPNEQTSAQGKAKPPVSHKKMVKLMAIEPVGKHGFRLAFDDQHSAIYPHLLLKEYAHNRNRLWHEYVQALEITGHSREAMIDIKQV